MAMGQIKNRRWQFFTVCVFVVIGLLVAFYFLRPSNKLIATTVSVATKKTDWAGKQIVEQRVIMLPTLLVPKTSRVMTEEELAHLQGQVEVEVCGRGLMKRSDIDDQMQSSAARKNVMQQIAGSLIASADEVDRMLGYTLNAYVSRWLDCTGDSCPNKLADQVASAEIISAAGRTLNPTVYVAALQFCDVYSALGCESLTARRWTEMQPQNAAAWLSYANELDRIKDGAAQNAAILRAAQTMNFDSARLPFGRVLQTALFQGMDLNSQLLATSTLISLYPAYNIAMSSSSIRYCHQDQMINVGRAAACVNLSALIEKNEPNMMGFIKAIALLKGTGLNKDKVAVMQSEYERLSQQMYAEAMTYLANPYSCEGAHDIIKNAADTIEGRELINLRKRMAASQNGVASGTQ